MLDKIDNIYITGYDVDGQNVVYKIIPIDGSVPQINFVIDSSEVYPIGIGRDMDDVRNWDRFIDTPKRTVHISAETKELHIITGIEAKDAIDQNKLLQLLSEEAS